MLLRDSVMLLCILQLKPSSQFRSKPCNRDYCCWTSSQDPEHQPTSGCTAQCPCVWALCAAFPSAPLLPARTCRRRALPCPTSTPQRADWLRSGTRISAMRVSRQQGRPIRTQLGGTRSPGPEKTARFQVPPQTPFLPPQLSAYSHRQICVFPTSTSLLFEGLRSGTRKRRGASTYVQAAGERDGNAAHSAHTHGHALYSHWSAGVRGSCEDVQQQ